MPPPSRNPAIFKKSFLSCTNNVSDEHLNDLVNAMCEYLFENRSEELLSIVRAQYNDAEALVVYARRDGCCQQLP